MSKATVLIIDDDADLLDELTEMLTCGGYNVLPCSNAVDAVRLAGASAPDVILVDVLMPELNGLQVIEKIKGSKGTARIPIVLTSGYCEESEGRKLARVNGLAGFVKKPMNPLEVIAEIERHVD